MQNNLKALQISVVIFNSFHLSPMENACFSNVFGSLQHAMNDWLSESLTEWLTDRSTDCLSEWVSEWVSEQASCWLVNDTINQNRLFTSRRCVVNALSWQFVLQIMASVCVCVCACARVCKYVREKEKACVSSKLLSCDLRVTDAAYE